MPLIGEGSGEPAASHRQLMAEKGATTVREAGRKGGTSTRKSYGREFYQSIGKKGGETTKQRMGPGFYERIGRKGGQKVKQLVALGKRAQKG